MHNIYRKYQKRQTYIIFRQVLCYIISHTNVLYKILECVVHVATCNGINVMMSLAIIFP